MSDAEFDLYRSALDECFAGLAATEENAFLNKINGTKAISDWFVVTDDRRVT